MTALVEFLPDHLNIRGPSAAGPALVAAIGYILLGTSGGKILYVLPVSTGLHQRGIGSATHVTHSERGGALGYIGDGRACLGENFPNTEHRITARECGFCVGRVFAYVVLQSFVL